MQRRSPEAPQRRAYVLELAVAWAAGLAWVLIPHPLEGPVVASLTAAHGLHLFDPVGLIPAALLSQRAWRQRP